MFDEFKGLEHDILSKWALLKTVLPLSVTKDLRSLEFLDDKVTIPLQCADLIAWHARQKFLDLPEYRKAVASAYDSIRPPDTLWRSVRWKEDGIRQHVEQMWASL